MTIDPAWLNEAIEMIAGRTCGDDEAQALARVLGEPDEVLPWLVLRQQTLVDEPAILEALADQARQLGQVQAGQANGTGTPAFALSAPLIELDRALNTTLARIVAEDVARFALDEELHGLFARRHAVAPSGPGSSAYGFRDRIGEPVVR